MGVHINLTSETESALFSLYLDRTNRTKDHSASSQFVVDGVEPFLARFVNDALSGAV